MCLDDDCGEEIDRRSFLAAATATVASLTLSERFASAQDKQPETRVLDDPKITHGRVVFKHNGVDTIDGFLARPKAEGVYPAVLVIAGNKISEEYIPNTCAALAVAGFVGLAPNIFHPLPDAAPRAEYDKYLAKHTEADVLDDIQQGITYLRAQTFVGPFESRPLGVIGFCFGGRIAMLLGARSRDIAAVVPYHPGVMKPEELTRLHVPVQIHHGSADRAVSVTESQKVEKVLKQQKTTVELFVYEGADHGFLAYTRPIYKPDAAKLAWTRTTQFLNQYLR